MRILSETFKLTNGFCSYVTGWHHQFSRVGKAVAIIAAALQELIFTIQAYLTGVRISRIRHRKGGLWHLTAGAAR